MLKKNKQVTSSVAGLGLLTALGNVPDSRLMVVLIVGAVIIALMFANMLIDRVLGHREVTHALDVDPNAPRDVTYERTSEGTRFTATTSNRDSDPSCSP